MDRQRKGIGVTGDEKKNHLCNYKFFWSGYLQQVWHGSHLAVKLAERKKKKRRIDEMLYLHSHTHTHSWILNIYKLLGTALETCTSRHQFGWKPGIGRKDKCFFLLLQASLFWDITTRKHQSTEPCWLDTAPDRVGSSQVPHERSHCLWNSYMCCILHSPANFQLPSGSYFCLWQLTCLFHFQ